MSSKESRKLGEAPVGVLGCSEGERGRARSGSLIDIIDGSIPLRTARYELRKTVGTHVRYLIPCHASHGVQPVHTSVPRGTAGSIVFTSVTIPYFLPQALKLKLSARLFASPFRRKTPYPVFGLRATISCSPPARSAFPQRKSPSRL